ncbi:MAG: autotransporter outer membrane beta-barrel domain-containing protein, partial [Pseudomonas sp.]
LPIHGAQAEDAAITERQDEFVPALVSLNIGHPLLMGLLGVPAPVIVTVANGVGITSGAVDSSSVSLRAANSTGVKADTGVQISFQQGTVANGAVTAATANGQKGLLADGGTINGSGVRIDMLPQTGLGVAFTANNMTGVVAQNGGAVKLDNSQVSMGGLSGSNNIGLLASGSGSSIDFNGGAISTLAKGSIGVLAKDGGSITLSKGTTVTTSGAVSGAVISHGLKAESGSHISASDVTVNTSGAAASGARAEGGSTIALTDSTFNSTNAATSTTTTAVLHALDGSTITGKDLEVTASGNYVGGARAEAGDIALSDSRISVTGAGVVANPAAAARAMAGGSLVIDKSILTAQGTYGHGVSVEGPGSQAQVTGSEISVLGARSIGLNVTAGAQAQVSKTQIAVDALLNAAGPWAPGVLVEGAGSSLVLSDSQVRTSQKSSYGINAG